MSTKRWGLPREEKQLVSTAINAPFFFGKKLPSKATKKASYAGCSMGSRKWCPKYTTTIHFSVPQHFAKTTTPLKTDMSPKKGPFKGKYSSKLCFRGHVSFRGSISATQKCNLRIEGTIRCRNDAGWTESPTSRCAPQPSIAVRPKGMFATLMPSATLGGFPNGSNLILPSGFLTICQDSYWYTWNL